MGGLRALAREMEEGTGCAGMALDGPRGPRHVPKAGSVWLAEFARAPVVPVWVEAPVSIRLQSWDRCVIPLPFSKVIVRVGVPFHPGSVEEIAEAMERLEKQGELRENPVMVGHFNARREIPSGVGRAAPLAPTASGEKIEE
ncbi:MAG: hypothetical protein JWO30_2949 [Fibrobacteres bacterium]|nr:hypothetical protein [Fibrobacterota bacterium]